MAKKIDEAEVKKECPSCGLGVALDATICEFCGWDFEEEDEWILQIEKLERDLMLEKQKFEPGTVNEKIESTLHAPTLERIEAMKAGQKTVESPAMAQDARPGGQDLRKQVPQPAPARPTVRPPESAAAEPPTQKVRRVRTVKTTPARESAESSTNEEPQEEPQGGGEKKIRVLRKAKQ